jgi:hypothetical protein
MLIFKRTWFPAGRRPSASHVAPQLNKLRCRNITEDDREAVIDLLTTGFGNDRDRRYWARAWQRLRDHVSPCDLPKYGLLLEADQVVVGVLLLIFSRSRDQQNIRCNVSSWYVQPAFRAYASLLSSRALRFPNVSYYNITPGRHTWPLLEAQGYKRTANGFCLTIPLLCRSDDATVSLATDLDILPDDETQILRDHQTKYDCLSVICRSDNTVYPFVFGTYRKFGMPIAHVMFSRHPDLIVRFIKPLGRFLLSRGYVFLSFDAQDRIPDLIGIYFAEWPQYSLGPHAPQLADLAYSERAMFGF